MKVGTTTSALQRAWGTETAVVAEAWCTIVRLPFELRKRAVVVIGAAAPRIDWPPRDRLRDDVGIRTHSWTLLRLLESTIEHGRIRGSSGDR